MTQTADIPAQKHGESLNPFEIALKQFNLAADHLNLDASMRKVLSTPKRALIVAFQARGDVLPEGVEQPLLQGTVTGVEIGGQDQAQAGAFGS